MKEKLALPAALDGQLWRYKESGYRHPPHRHDELEFNLVLRGRASYLMDRQRVDIQRGSLVWLFPGQEHVLLGQSPDYAMWIAIFRADMVRRVTAGRGGLRTLRARRPEGQFCRLLAEPGAIRLAALLAEVEAITDDPPRRNAGLAYVLLSAWAAYGHDGPMALGPDVHPAVERAARLLQDDPAALDLELPALAARAGLSASRLSRLFHAQTGATLTDFRNRQRVQRFLRIYEGGRRWTLMEAALEAGFGSYPQFHRVFRKLVGHPPAAHKRTRE